MSDVFSTATWTSGRSEAVSVCPAPETSSYELAVDVGTHIETRVVEITVNGGGQAPGPGAGTPGVPAYQTEAWVYTGGSHAHTRGGLFLRSRPAAGHQYWFSLQGR